MAEKSGSTCVSITASTRKLGEASKSTPTLSVRDQRDGSLNFFLVTKGVGLFVFDEEEKNP
jgi:hypothetical protein